MTITGITGVAVAVLVVVVVVVVLLVIVEVVAYHEDVRKNKMQKSSQIELETSSSRQLSACNKLRTLHQEAESPTTSLSSTKT